MRPPCQQYVPAKKHAYVCPHILIWKHGHCSAGCGRRACERDVTECPLQPGVKHGMRMCRYSFNHGPIHFIQTSTEQPFGAGSPQWQ